MSNSFSHRSFLVVLLMFERKFGNGPNCDVICFSRWGIKSHFLYAKDLNTLLFSAPFSWIYYIRKLIITHEAEIDWENKHSQPQLGFRCSNYKKCVENVNKIFLPPSISRDRRAASRAFPQEFLLIIDTISGASLVKITENSKTFSYNSDLSSN